MVIRRRFYFLAAPLLIAAIAATIAVVNQQMTRPHELGPSEAIAVGPDGCLEIQTSGCFLRSQDWPSLRFRAISLTPKLVLHLKRNSPERLNIRMDNLSPEAALQGADAVETTAGGKTVTMMIQFEGASLRTVEWKAPPETGTFCFYAFGDNHEQYEILEKIRQDAIRERPLFIAHAGDLTNHGTEEALLKHEEFADTIPAPYFTCLGNHDLEEGTRSARPYHRIFGPSFYAFDYGDAAFIFLDNASGHISLQQLKWLNNQLRLHKRDDRIFIFAHQPALDPRRGHHHAMKPLIGGAGLLTALAEKAGVDFFISGHLHTYYEFEWAGATHIITGNAKPGGTEPPLPFSHYTKFIVGPDGVKHVPRFLIEQEVPEEQEAGKR